jgi:hypothetical protein
MNRYAYPTFKRPKKAFLVPEVGDRVRISDKGKEYMRDAVSKHQMMQHIMALHLARVGTYVEVASTESDQTRVRVVWDDDHSETRERTFWPLEYLERAS